MTRKTFGALAIAQRHPSMFNTMHLPVRPAWSAPAECHVFLPAVHSGPFKRTLVRPVEVIFVGGGKP
jgi:hypothetical protein